MSILGGVAGIAADADTMTEAVIHYATPEWTALIEWLEFHGIDPHRIPAGTRVSRDECNRCIRYVEVVYDERGRPRHHGPDHPRCASYVTVGMVEQGEAPPLPYPDVVQALLVPVPQGSRS